MKKFIFTISFLTLALIFALVLPLFKMTYAVVETTSADCTDTATGTAGFQKLEWTENGNIIARLSVCQNSWTRQVPTIAAKARLHKITAVNLGSTQSTFWATRQTWYCDMTDSLNQSGLRNCADIPLDKGQIQDNISIAVPAGGTVDFNPSSIELTLQNKPGTGYCGSAQVDLVNTLLKRSGLADTNPDQSPNVVWGYADSTTSCPPTVSAPTTAVCTVTPNKQKITPSWNLLAGAGSYQPTLRDSAEASVGVLPGTGCTNSSSGTLENVSNTPTVQDFPLNTYTVSVTAYRSTDCGATGGGVTGTSPTVTNASCTGGVEQTQLTVDCTPPTGAAVGNSVSWNAFPRGGSGVYSSYSWTGTDELNGKTGNPASVTYSTNGLKTGSVTVTDSTGATATSTNTCQVDVGAPPPPPANCTGTANVSVKVFGDNLYADGVTGWPHYVWDKPAVGLTTGTFTGNLQDVSRTPFVAAANGHYYCGFNDVTGIGDPDTGPACYMAAFPFSNNSDMVYPFNLQLILQPPGQNNPVTNLAGWTAHAKSTGNTYDCGDYDTVATDTNGLATFSSLPSTKSGNSVTYRFSVSPPVGTTGSKFTRGTRYRYRSIDPFGIGVELLNCASGNDISTCTTSYTPGTSSNMLYFTFGVKNPLDLTIGPNSLAASKTTQIYAGDPITFRGTMIKTGPDIVFGVNTTGTNVYSTFELDLNSNTFISADVTLLPNPITFNDTVNNPPIGIITPGTVNSWTAQVGTHTLRMCVDAGPSHVTEDNENNNCADLTFTVTEPPTNLVARPLSLTAPNPTNIIAGDAVTFLGAVSNTGAAAAAFKTRFCLDNTDCLNNTTGRVGTSDLDVASLAKDAILAQSVPWTATLGSHTLHYCVDVGKQITESNETTDNCSTLPFTVGALPQVTTNDPTSITSTTATFNGVATVPTGASAISEHGFLYMASTTVPTCTAASVGSCTKVSNTGVPTGTGGSFTNPLTNLTPGTIYWVKAYAKNTAGESTNTDWKSFTTFDFGIDNPLPANITLVQGTTAGSNTVTVKKLKGTQTNPVTLSISTLPAGVTSEFSPTSCTPLVADDSTCPITLTLTPTLTATTGTSAITVTGTQGATTRTATFNLTVNPPASVFDFTLSNPPDPAAIVKGGNGSSTGLTVTRTANSNIEGEVSLSVVDFTLAGTTYTSLNGVSADFSPTSCTTSGASHSCPPTPSILTIAAAGDSSAPTGTYRVKVRGTYGAATHDKEFNLTIYPPLAVSCAPSPLSPVINQNIIWTVNATGGTGTYTYTWPSGSPHNLTQSITIPNTAANSYALDGPQTFNMTVDSGGPKIAVCSVTVNPPPPTVTLTAVPATVTSGGSTTLTWNVTGSAASCTRTSSAPSFLSGIDRISPTNLNTSIWDTGLADTANIQNSTDYPVTFNLTNTSLTGADQTNTFTITCTNAGGPSAPVNAAIIVKALPGLFTLNTPKSINLTSGDGACLSSGNPLVYSPTVYLSWVASANVDPVTRPLTDRYEIWRAPISGTFTQIGTIANANLFYTDLTPVANTAYTYKIIAFTSGGFKENNKPNPSVTTAYCDFQKPVVNFVGSFGQCYGSDNWGIERPISVQAYDPLPPDPPSGVVKVFLQINQRTPILEAIPPMATQSLIATFPVPWVDLTLNSLNTLSIYAQDKAGNISLVTTSLEFRASNVCLKPWVKTKDGDVHSNTDIRLRR